MSNENLDLFSFKYEKLKKKDQKQTIEVKEAEKLVIRDETAELLTKEISEMVSFKLQSVSRIARLIIFRTKRKLRLRSRGLCPFFSRDAF